MCNKIDYMSLAIEEAKKGIGYTSPNPVVGCVIVKNNSIIATGYHQKHGGPHAEVNALAYCREKNIDTTGATMYVTLEPCNHTGKTPPCSQAIIDAKISRVVIAVLDPNEHASGGYKTLQQAGIEVQLNILKEEATELNEIFFHYINTGLPFVLQKYAMTLDGKIATHTGASKYITGKESLERVHQDRHKHTAIMVGVGTVVDDDPKLNCRTPKNPVHPVRIICDTNLRTPVSSHVVQTAKEIKTIIATAITDSSKQAIYLNYGVEIITVPKDKNIGIDLVYLMKELGNYGIDSILLEGGSQLHWSALNSGIVNKINAYIAPKIFGGSTAKSPIGGMGVNEPHQAFTLTNIKTHVLGQDYMIEGYPKCSRE